MCQCGDDHRTTTQATSSQESPTHSPGSFFSVKVFCYFHARTRCGLTFFESSALQRFTPLCPLAMGDYLIPVSSPLDTLVRKTSSRRRPNDIQIPLPQGASDEHALYPEPPILDAPPPKRPFGNPPQSPLLHNRFRTSVATQLSLNTSAELYRHIHGRMASGTQDFAHDEDASIYST